MRYALLMLLAGCGLSSIDLGHDEDERTRYAITGNDVTCFVLGDVVKCAGTNERGQLPLGSASATISTCDGLPCTDGAQTSALPRFDELVIGLGFGCIREGTRVTCYGANGLGQLGNGFTDDAAHPFVPVPVEDVEVVSIVAGRHHVCGLESNGHVLCWGAGASGALGIDPEALATCSVNDASDAASLEVELGTSIACSKAPRRVPGIDDASRLFAGPFATCVERISGGIHCFGHDDVGQLGNGGRRPIRFRPARLEVTRVRALALGERHGCALRESGEVRCFGSHAYGQLGIGPGAPDDCDGEPCALSHRRPLFTEGVIDLVATDFSTCAVFSNGDVYCAGLDALGELGDSDHGTPMSCSGLPCSGTPVQVYDVLGMYRADGVGSLVARGRHLIGRRADGTFFAWGDNRRRQLGMTSPSPVTFPSQVYGIGP